MPPRKEISIAHFLTVADVARSARSSRKVFGARILSLGDGNAPGTFSLQISWMILNVGGGPTPDKPTVTLQRLTNHINTSLPFALPIFNVPPMPESRRRVHHGADPQIRRDALHYIRDPDGYIIEVGQSTGPHLRLTLTADGCRARNSTAAMDWDDTVIRPS